MKITARESHESIVTYSDLLTSDLLLSTIGKGSISAYKSTLNTLMEHFQLGANDDTQSVLGADFKEKVKTFLTRKDARSVAAIRSERSRMKKWKEISDTLNARTHKVVAFKDTLGNFLRLHHHTVHSAAQASKISVSTLENWLLGLPPKNVESVRQLEVSLNVENGTLTAHLPSTMFFSMDVATDEWLAINFHHGMSATNKDALLRLLPDGYDNLSREQQFKELEAASLKLQRGKGQIPYRLEAYALSQKPYAHAHAQWTYDLQNEWSSLVTYKTTPPAFGQPNQGLRWRMTTASMRLEYIERFFGYLLLSPVAEDPQLCGAGLSANELTLSLLVFPKFIFGYVAFLSSRGGMHAGIDTTIDFFQMLLRPNTGFLWRHPEMFTHLGMAQFYGRS